MLGGCRRPVVLVAEGRKDAAVLGGAGPASARLRGRERERPGRLSGAPGRLPDPPEGMPAQERAELEAPKRPVRDIGPRPFPHSESSTGRPTMRINRNALVVVTTPGL